MTLNPDLKDTPLFDILYTTKICIAPSRQANQKRVICKKRYNIKTFYNASCSQLMGFDSVRGQNSPSPIDLAGRR